jgi:hypothetical protein
MYQREAGGVADQYESWRKVAHFHELAPGFPMARAVL